MHKLFQLVPEIQKKEYNQYLENSAEKKVQIGDYCWNYRIFSEYGSWIVILPGFRYSSSMYYQYALRLARRFKVLVLDFPEVSEIKEILSAIKTITEKENINEFTVIGFGDFGFIAPLVCREFPEKCSKLVMSNTYFNSVLMPNQLREELKESLVKAEKSLKYATKKAVSKRLKKSWDGIPAKIIGEELFWQTYVKAQSLECTKENESAYYNLVMEFLDSYVLNSDEFADCKCMFIDVINDKDTVRKDISIAVRDFFPDLVTVEEKNSDDAAVLSRKTSLISKIDCFIKENIKDVQD